MSFYKCKLEHACLVSKTSLGLLVWVPLKAEPEARIWVQVADVEGDAGRRR